MLEFTLGTIFGFVAGCSLKDFILSKLDKCKRFQIPQSLIKIEKTSLHMIKLKIYTKEIKTI